MYEIFVSVLIWTAIGAVSHALLVFIRIKFAERREACMTPRDTDIHGEWIKEEERYEDGTDSHLCEKGCTY